MRWLLVLLAILLLVAVAFVIAVAVHAQDLRQKADAVPGACAPVATSTPRQPSVHQASSRVDENDPLGIPITSGRDVQVLHKPHFTIGYDNATLEPAWVSYDLQGPIRFHGSEQRPLHFAIDLDVRNPAKDSDYVHSGYDRGHMCPAYAMFSRFGQGVMEETFITSNIIPQVHALNAGMWEALETNIAGRDGSGDGWAGTFGEVWVTDGPVLGSSPEHFRAGEAIPRGCFMIIARKLRDDRYGTIAFEMRNEQANDRLESYLVSIRQIEHDTGIDFDTALSVEAQEALEAEPAKQVWPMSTDAPSTNPTPAHHRKHR